MDFTDLNLTAYGGSSILAQTARRRGLFELLDEAVRVKVRNRGATDAETLRAMIASLARLRTRDVKGLWEAARRFAEWVAPLVVGHQVETRGCVSVIIDATGIEVDGELFERARKGWEGRRGYWLHEVFLGGLLAAGQLGPGGGRVTLNWWTLLEWTAGMCRRGSGGQCLLQGGTGADLRGVRRTARACWFRTTV